MNNLGSFLENPQINNEMCRVAAEVFGDCLRTKAGLTRKSNTTHPDMIRVYESAKSTNTFTEDLIKKFEDRLMILLIHHYPYERKIIKNIELPDILNEAALFNGFKLYKEQLPNFIQINVNGDTINLFPVNKRTDIKHTEDDMDFHLLYDAKTQEWI